MTRGSGERSAGRVHAFIPLLLPYFTGSVLALIAEASNDIKHLYGMGG